MRGPPKVCDPPPRLARSSDDRMARFSTRYRPSPRPISRMSAGVMLLGAALAGSARTAHAQPGLTIAKSHSGSFTAGTNGSYQLILRNVGLSSTLGVTTVRDTLPAGVLYVSAVGFGWTATTSGQVVTCTRAGLMAPGDTS